MKAISAKERVFLVVMMMNFKVYLMSVNLYGIHEDDDIVDSYIKRKDRFGMRLPLPFHSYPKEGVVTFSNVTEEQLAVLFQRKETLRM
ncbi:hypothetical protein DY000_02042728 [Brassica cretica]|uniref:Uncharacterized protein n=1 Tax=Brassica cretica TaxID=69181 RepID=A0ABQ7BA42_BRACR|nr:hypothetical protein DY000_02042728 [Brassica cretica]